MADILTSFKNAVNNASDRKVPVVGEEIAPQPSLDLSGVKMYSSMAHNKPVTIAEQAETAYDADSTLSNTIALEKDGGEVPIFFPEMEIRLPAYFDSYDQLAHACVGNIVRSESLTNINTSFFGPVLENTSPNGFSRVSVGGKHEFFVLNKSDRITYVFEFLAKAKNSILDSKVYKCSFTMPVNINGSIAYTMILTPKEMMDITRSFPAYQLLINMDEDISKLELILRIK